MQLDGAVVVAVSAVGVVEMAAHYIIGVPGVGHGFMPAAGAVDMRAGVPAAIVLGGAAVGMLRAGGELVVVYMAVVHVVHVAFMQIVDVPIVLDLRMPAANAMGMSMAFVRFAVHDAFMLALLRRQVCAETSARPAGLRFGTAGRLVRGNPLIEEC
jgi:hypothetical protein